MAALSRRGSTKSSSAWRSKSAIAGSSVLSSADMLEYTNLGSDCPEQTCKFIFTHSPLRDAQPLQTPPHRLPSSSSSWATQTHLHSAFTVSTQPSTWAPQTHLPLRLHRPPHRLHPALDL